MPHVIGIFRAIVFFFLYNENFIFIKILLKDYDESFLQYENWH